MPYKDRDKQREWMRNWMAGRRTAFFVDKVCARCGSKENLTLHHVDPKTKIDHKVWSWSKVRRDAEIAKCIVLCNPCHINHHAEQQRTFVHGVASTYKSKGCRCDACREAEYRTKIKLSDRV